MPNMTQVEELDKLNTQIEKVLSRLSALTYDDGNGKRAQNWCLVLETLLLIRKEYYSEAESSDEV